MWLAERDGRERGEERENEVLMSYGGLIRGLCHSRETQTCLPEDNVKWEDFEEEVTGERQHLLVIGVLLLTVAIGRVIKVQPCAWNENQSKNVRAKTRATGLVDISRKLQKDQDKEEQRQGKLDGAKGRKEQRAMDRGGQRDERQRKRTANGQKERGGEGEGGRDR